MTDNYITEGILRDKISRHRLWINREGELKEKDQLSLTDTLIADITMTEENFSCAELVRCRIVNSRFIRCDFSYSVLLESIGEDCSFLNCNFVKADLKDTCFEKNTFAGSDFTRADLSSAKLVGADLTDCLLNWAWLIETDLRFANLEGTSFEGARLIKTRISSSKNYNIKSIHKAVVKDIDFSREGDGTTTGGVELLESIITPASR